MTHSAVAGKGAIKKINLTVRAFVSATITSVIHRLLLFVDGGGDVCGDIVVLCVRRGRGRKLRRFLYNQLRYSSTIEVAGGVVVVLWYRTIDALQFCTHQNKPEYTSQREQRLRRGCCDVKPEK